MELYYVIFLAVMILTLPFGAESVIFSPKNLGGGFKYDPLGSFSRSQRKILYAAFALIALGLIMLCAGRPETMPDYLMYKMLYEMGGGDRINRDIEPSFTMLVNLSPTFIFMITAYAILSVSAHVYAIVRNSPNIWVSFLVYLSFYFVLHDMVQMRAAVAAGLLLLNVRYIAERKIIPFMLITLVAAFFHASALIFIPLYFIPRKSLNKWIWSGVLIVSLALGLTNNAFGYLAKFIPLEIVENYLYAYLGSHDHTATKIGLTHFCSVAIGIFMLFNLDSIKKRYPYAVVVVLLYIISQLFYLLFADLPVMQTRMGELFGTFEIFGLAMLPMVSKKYYYPLMIVACVIAFVKFPLALFLLNGK